jgi:hypothetical protein
MITFAALPLVGAALLSAPVEPMSAVNPATCANTWARRAQIMNGGLLRDCAEFYFHRQDLDVPVGSYNRVIDLDYRLLELTPRDLALYSDTVFLLYSKHVTWKRDPIKMPDGEFKLREGFELLQRGERYNRGSAAYHFMAAESFFLPARYHSSEYGAFVVASFEQADILAKPFEKQIKINSRNQLGRWHHVHGDKVTAKAWFLKVLELDPENEHAKAYLRSYEN